MTVFTVMRVSFSVAVVIIEDVDPKVDLLHTQRSRENDHGFTTDRILGIILSKNKGFKYPHSQN